MFPGDREQGSGKKKTFGPRKSFFKLSHGKILFGTLKSLIWWARGKNFSGPVQFNFVPLWRRHMHQKCTRRSSLAAPACHQRKRWTQTGATLCLQRTPARLLRTRIRVFHGLERPPKTRLEKNSQRHGPGTLSVRVFEPQYWSEGVWQKNFSSTEKFCLLQTLARCLGGTGWTWNKLLAAWKVYFGGFGIYLLPLHSRLVLYKFNSTTCLNHQNKLSSSPKVLFHGSVPSTCPKTAHTP